MSHKFNVRVYYEDTDLGEIVYHANYLKFTERARTEMLRDAGIEQGPLKEELGIGFVVRKMEIEYLAPARYGDLLTVVTELEEMKRASFVLRQKVMRDEKLLFDSQVVIVSVSLHEMRATNVPAIIRDVIEKNY